MKNLLYLSLIVLLFAGCETEEEFLKNQPFVSFYPTLSANAVEEQSATVKVSVEASREITDVSTIVVTVINGEFLTTDPPIVDNKLTLTFDGNNIASFFITVGDDDIAGDYEATFTIAETSGQIKAIANGIFTLSVSDNDREVLFADDFEANNLSKWTTVNTAGGNNWGVRSFADNFYAVISNFQSSVPAESWLISPAINFDDAQFSVLTFLSETAYNDGNLLEVSVLTNYSGDVTTATKTVLNPVLDPHRGSGFGAFTGSGSVDLSSITGVGHVAFHYTASGTDDGSQWQLDDVQVTGVVTSGGGGSDDLFELPFNDDFENCVTAGAFNIPENWTEALVSGSKTDRGWGCDLNDGVSASSSVRASSFGGAAGTDNAWLISAKKFGLKTASAASLSFDIKSVHSGAGELKAFWSDNYTSGDPSAATWTELTEVTSNLPVQQSATYKNIVASLDAALGKNVFIAFQFSGGTETSSASYDIDNLSVSATAGGGGGGGSGDPFTLPFTDDFENCAVVGDFEIPENWVEVLAAGSKTDRGWGCRAFGRNASNGVRASTFGGAAGTDDAWLVSAKPFDLTGASSPKLVFWLESRFTGPGEVKVYWSSDYAGNGTITSGTWNELTDVNSQIPAENSVTFTEITSNLSVISATEVYLAFRYFGGQSDASEAFTLDDLTVSAQ